MYPNLNAEMARLGITRKELAQKINMAEATLSFKMNGKTKFTFDEILKIKEMLGVDIPLEELFKKVG